MVNTDFSNTEVVMSQSHPVSSSIRTVLTCVSFVKGRVSGNPPSNASILQDVPKDLLDIRSDGLTTLKNPKYILPYIITPNKL